MSPAGSEQLLAELRASRDAIHEAIAGVSETQAVEKKGDGWSVRDCVEHLAIAERGMLRMITQSAAGEVGVRVSQEESIREYGTNRSERTQAPGGAEPTGRYESLALAISKFDEARERTIAHVAECGNELRGRLLDHPVRGHITAYECAILMAQHSIRHAAQIREAVAQ